MLPAPPPMPTPRHALPAPTDALGELLADLLAAPTLTLDALRDAVVRAARAARALAVTPEAMLATLAVRVRARVHALQPPRRAELLARAQWWAIHGYYGDHG